MIDNYLDKRTVTVIERVLFRVMKMAPEGSMMASQIPWERMVQVLMQCGSVHDAHSFSVNAIEQIRTLIPFDQGRVYFFNDNAEIYDEFLLGVDKRVTRVYHEYYANVEGGLYNAAKRAWNFHGKYPPVHNSGSR